MIFRLIQIVLPNDKKEQTKRIIEKMDVMDYSYSMFSKTHLKFDIIVKMDRSEELLEIFQKEFSGLDGFRIIIIPIETYIPFPEEESNIGNLETKKQSERISREEIYAHVSEMSQLTRIYMVLVAASAFVASIGLLNDDVAVIIGAMIIAPLLGPNIGLSLATVMGNRKFIVRSVKTNLIGFLIAAAVSIVVGMIFAVNPQNPSIVLRTDIGRGSFFLALASGLAGSLALTTGLTSALVGVMIAVALMPPLAAFGLLIGSGNFYLAFGAFLLFLVNLISINLAATISFMAQNIKPIEEEESRKAKIITQKSIMVLASILIILFALIRFHIIY
ncbi:TIGR00341 family protein [Methanobacterium sp.]|jgi:uncharacterized hydrophobic protein (TIGR00341 family)|uniref:TIGR00341 family protein n=1 Tax=Methanobacterium sp. TaxID=2164 RepID=UPI0031589A25